MAKKAICLITLSEDERGAYGITTDTNETVYFPISIANAVGINEFEEIEAIIIPNDRPEPFWKAIRARRVGVEQQAA